MVNVGDIVLYDGHVWDVIGCQQLLPHEDGGDRPTRLKLLRVYRPDGRRKQTFRETCDARDAILVGRQDGLPGLLVEEAT